MFPCESSTPWISWSTSSSVSFSPARQTTVSRSTARLTKGGAASQHTDASRDITATFKCCLICLHSNTGNSTLKNILNCSILEKTEYFRFFSVSFCSQWKQSENYFNTTFWRNGVHSSFEMPENSVLRLHKAQYRNWARCSNCWAIPAPQGGGRRDGLER